MRGLKQGQRMHQTALTWQPGQGKEVMLLGLFSKLFKFVKVRYVYSGTPARSAPFNKEAYEQEIVRAVIDCIATHAAKAEAMHVILDKDGRIKEIKRNSPYVKLLNQRPNPLMTGFDQVQACDACEANTTTMCYIRWNGTIRRWWYPFNTTVSRYALLTAEDMPSRLQTWWHTGAKHRDVVILESFQHQGRWGMATIRYTTR